MATTTVTPVPTQRMKVTPEQQAQLTQSLPGVCSHQDAIERTSRYDLMGNISGISFTGTCTECALKLHIINPICKACSGTGRGYLDFPAERMALAYSRDKRGDAQDGNGNVVKDAILEPGGVILFAGPWPGLSAVRDVQPEVCDQCGIDCPECEASGKRQCMTCGGEGSYNPQPSECPAPGCAKQKKKFNPKCESCNGTGVKMIREKCPNCEGSKVQTCPACLGSKKMPTGLTADGMAACPACNGNKRKQNLRQQALEPHVLCEAGQYLVLGPIEIIYLHRKGFAGKNGPCRLRALSDSGGNPMLMVLSQKHAGGRAYIVSGQFDAEDLQRLNDESGGRFARSG